MKLIKTFIIIFMSIFVSVVLVNSIVHGGILAAQKIVDVYDTGAIIKFKPYAYAFVHGSYGCDWVSVDNVSVCNKHHFTYYNDSIIKTIDFVNELKNDGYTKVWGSWCHAGDSEYIVIYHNGSKIRWEEDIGRNKLPGYSLPIFTGLGLEFISFPTN